MRLSATVKLVRAADDDESCKDCDAGGPCDWHGAFTATVSGEVVTPADYVCFAGLRLEGDSAWLALGAFRDGFAEDEMEDVQQALEEARRTEAAQAILTEVADPQEMALARGSSERFVSLTVACVVATNSFRWGALCKTDRPGIPGRVLALWWAAATRAAIAKIEGGS